MKKLSIILALVMAIGTIGMLTGCGGSSSSSGGYGVGADDDNGYLDYDDPEAFDIYRDAWDDAVN